MLEPGTQPGELALDLLLATRFDLGQLALERRDALAAERRLQLAGGARPGLRREGQLALDALDACGQAARRAGHLLGAQAQALVCRARLIDPPCERVMALGALGQQALRPAPAVDRRLQQGLDARSLRARLPDPLLGLAQLLAGRPRAVARELQARFQQLVLEALMQLGSLGLALQRPQPRARLALDVERPVEVLLRALELQLRAPAALAMLAQSSRLLDQQAPLARPGVDDRVDAPLGDDGVRLLAEARVGEHLDDVGQAGARAVEAVAALARAIEAAHDRDLAQRQIDGAVAVVEHDLHLGLAAGLHAAPATEDHVLHRLPAHRQRRLLAHRPQHRVGHVGLARSVGADHHADTRTEVQSGAVGKGLEALQRERLQAHAARSSPRHSPSSVSTATRAASCSACFLLRPLPLPSTRPSTRARTS